MKTINNPVKGKPMPEFLTGVITPMFTACNQDGSLDEEGIRSHVQWLKKTEAVSTLFVRSGVGKMFTFSVEETKRMAEIVIDEAKRDLYVLVGASGDFSKGKPREEKHIEESLELGKFAQESGATGAVFVSFGLESTGNIDEKVFGFYEQLNDSLDLPIIIYQPGGTPAPFLMKPKTLGRIASLPNLMGMKVSTTDMKIFGDLCLATQDKEFTMISGAETAFLPSLILGAGAVIGEGCNTYPQLLRAIFDYFIEGDLKNAARAQFLVNKTLDVWSGLDSALVGKSYMARKGVKIKRESRRMKLDIEPLLDRFEKAIDLAVAPYRKG